MECSSKSLSDVSKSNNVCYILGEFNNNIHPECRTTYANNYINLLLSHEAFPLTTEQTRLTENSVTITDHIISNDTIIVLLPGNIQTDHYPIDCSVKYFIVKIKSKRPKCIYYRDKSSFYAEHFCEDLDNNLSEF